MYEHLLIIRSIFSMKQIVQNWMKTTGLHSGLPHFSTNSDPKAVTFMFNES